MEKTCAVVAFRLGALSLSPPQSAESPKVVSVVQPTSRKTPSLDTEATRSAILQCFHEFAEPDLVVEDASLDSLGLDSISIVELRNSIANETGVELENAMILTNPSVAEIIETVLSSVDRVSASPVAVVSDRDEQELQLSVKRLDPVLHPHARAVARPALFVLSTPRAGSSLLQLCLEASPLLYAPQELMLLPFDTLDERIKVIGRAAGLDGGLIAAVGNLRGDAGALVASWENARVSTCHAYRMLAEWTAPRLFCDKTPGYAFDSTILSRAERLMASPRYLSTVRHPVACIESWIELERKNLILQNRDASKVTWADIEAKYCAFNGNIIDFLKTIPVHRRMSMRYEDLVTDPAGTLSTICDELLMIPYDDAMADPYAAGATKTFEAGSTGVAATDPKLLKHKRISPTLADKWKTVQVPSPGLAPDTKRLGWDLGYRFRTFSGFRVIDETVEDGCLCWLARGDPGADIVVIHYDGLGFKYGRGLDIPDGFGLVALQAPEYADPRTVDPGMTEARAMREACVLTKHLSGRTVHLVGYSFGGPLVAATCAAFAKLGTDAPCVASILLVDPLPFGSMPSDVPRSEDSLVASARLLDGLSSKLRYVDQEGSLVAAVQAGDVASASSLVLALREMLPSDDACEEITRIARFLETCDMTMNWDALPKLDDIPVVVFKTAGGPTHFQSRHRANWNHEDGIYGWSALRPIILATPPTILEGGHFDAFSGQANLKALSDGLAALVRVAQC